MLAQVSDWLRVVGLEECVLFFRDAGIDGAGLLQLRQLSSTEPETFYAMAENKLGIHKFGLVSRGSTVSRRAASPHCTPFLIEGGLYFIIITPLLFFRNQYLLCNISHQI